jgi:L-threonylcarbamoyladenylate synthase
VKIVPIDGVKIDDVIEVLNTGGLVIFPCETVYGAAVDALNEEAVHRLNLYKQRPFGKPFAIMANSQNMTENYVEINDTAKNLYRNFLPGPLTVVSQGKHKVAKGIESETGSLGVRIPDYKFMLDLIGKFGRPIVATSANASYKRRPYKTSDILENISDKQKSLIDLIIDAGELPHNEPSTVIDTTLDDVVTLRQGSVVIPSANSGQAVISRSEENTRNIGKELWQKFEKYSGQRAIIFALEGEMGVGKTQLTKGVARAMGIQEEIISPTFNLEIDYGKLIHIDAWRMQKDEELESLNFAGNISDKSVIVIEWADRVVEAIRKHYAEAVVIWIKIEYGNRINERKIFWRTL